MECCLCLENQKVYKVHCGYHVCHKCYNLPGFKKECPICHTGYDLFLKPPDKYHIVRCLYNSDSQEYSEWIEHKYTNEKNGKYMTWRWYGGDSKHETLLYDDEYSYGNVIKSTVIIDGEVEDTILVDDDEYYDPELSYFDDVSSVSCYSDDVIIIN